jgi:hypothetical protein
VLQFQRRLGAVSATERQAPIEFGIKGFSE